MIDLPFPKQMAFMHGYMKYTQPLFIQAIMALKGIYDSKVSVQSLRRLSLC